MELSRAGTSTSAGPEDMTTVTELPDSTGVPASGSERRNMPASTSALVSASAKDGTRSAASSSAP